MHSHIVSGVYKQLIIVLIFIVILNSAFPDEYPKPILNMSPFFGMSAFLHQSADADILEFGNGFLIGFGLSNMFVNNLYSQIFLDMELSTPVVEDAHYFNHYDVVFSLGYHILLMDFVLITPALGGGVIFHHQSGNILYSPHFNVGSILDINLVKNLHLFFSFDVTFQYFEYDYPIYRFQLGVKNRYLVIPDIPGKAKASIHITPDLFSPDGDNQNDLAEIWLDVTAGCRIKNWVLTIFDPQNQPLFTSSGKGTVPEKQVWDGMSLHGKPVESFKEYPVMLELYDEYDRKTEARSVISTGLVAEKEKIPGETEVSIRITPDLFSPDGDDWNDLAEIWLDVTAFCEMKHWELTIFDRGDQVFFFTSADGPVPEKISWDGISLQGERVESAMEYPVVFKLYDEYDRKTEANAVIITDVLVFEKNSRLYIRIPVITFEPYSTSLIVKDSVDKTTKNLEILNRLVELFTRFKEYTIRIEGHANHLDWMNPVKKRIEQETILLPLSLKRAEKVKETLVILGIEEERITAAGFGGEFPLVPFDDPVNNWKNRRVEFVLFKGEEMEQDD